MVGRDSSLLRTRTFQSGKSLFFCLLVRWEVHIPQGGCFAFSENVVFLLLSYFEGCLSGSHRPCRRPALSPAQSAQDGLHASWSRAQRSGFAGRPRWVRRRVLPRSRRVLILRSELQWRSLDA